MVRVGVALTKVSVIPVALPVMAPSEVVLLYIVLLVPPNAEITSAPVLLPVHTSKADPTALVAVSIPVPNPGRLTEYTVDCPVEASTNVSLKQLMNRASFAEPSPVLPTIITPTIPSPT